MNSKLKAGEATLIRRSLRSRSDRGSGFKSDRALMSSKQKGAIPVLYIGERRHRLETS